MAYVAEAAPKSIEGQSTALGSITQLYARGSQDRYLTVCPSFSYWQPEPIPCAAPYQQKQSDVPLPQTLVIPGEHFIPIPRDGDVLVHATLCITLPLPSSAWKRWLCYRIIQQVQIQVGGTLLFNISGAAMLLNDKYHRAKKTRQITELMTDDGFGGCTLYVPLDCMLGRNGLPVAAMWNEDLTMVITFDSVQDLMVVPDGVTSSFSAKLYATWALFFPGQRRSFYQGAFQQLIEQYVEVVENNVQDVSTTTTLSVFKAPIDVTGPVKSFLICVSPRNADEMVMHPADFESQNTTPLLQSISFALDGTIIEETLLNAVDYYSVATPVTKYNVTPLSPNIFALSFCISPEMLQPSGMVDMGAHTAYANMTMADGVGAVDIRMLVVSYNSLNTQGGNASLAFVH